MVFICNRNVRGTLRAVKAVQPPKEGMSQELKALIDLSQVIFITSARFYVHMLNFPLQYDHLFVQFLGWYMDLGNMFMFFGDGIHGIRGSKCLYSSTWRVRTRRQEHNDSNLGGS